MATFAGAVFDEISTAAVSVSTTSTDPNFRYRAGGGEIRVEGSTETTIQLDVYCDGENLAALRVALLNGVVDDLELDVETVVGAQLTEIAAPSAVFDSENWRVSLTFEQVTEVITPSIGVNLNGLGIGDVLQVSTNVGRESRFATATVHCATSHGSRGDSVEIYADIGSGAIALFKGTLERISREYYPGAATLECSGTLKRLQRQWNHLEEYTGQEDSAMIVNFIEKRDGLHSIESSGWILGQRQPVLVQPGDTFISWVDELDEISRYWTYDRHDGAVYRRRNDPTELGASSRTFTEGVDILSVSLNEDYDAIRNRIIVKGISLEGVQIATESYGSNSDLDTMMPGTAPNYNVQTIQSDLIEMPDHMFEVADRALSDLNRVRRWLELKIPFDPSIVTDDTITVVAPSIGVNNIVMIWEVKHTVDGEGGTTQIITNQGNL